MSLSKEIIEAMANESMKNRTRLLPTKRNQLALWLGRLVIAFNDLEYSLAREISSELSLRVDSTKVNQRSYLQYDEDMVDIMMASMSFGQKLNFFSALFLKRFDGNNKQQKHIGAVVTAISKAGTFRNQCVHSVWKEPMFSENYSRRNARIKEKKLKISNEAANIKSIKTAIEDICFLQPYGIYSVANEKLAAKIGINPFLTISKNFKQTETDSRHLDVTNIFIPRLTA